jgi:hypothetical protein
VRAEARGIASIHWVFVQRNEFEYFESRYGELCRHDQVLQYDLMAHERLSEGSVPAMPKLVVGSVFTSGARTERWLALQMKFLRQTTECFVHAVFLAGDVRREMFAESEIIGTHPVDKVSAPGCEQSQNHAIGLEAILRYFRATPADNYLVLDSDCFPVLP